MTDLDWPNMLDEHEAELDAAIREDAMRNALALVSASGRASRYAKQCTGGPMADPVLYRRIYRWAMARLTGGM